MNQRIDQFRDFLRESHSAYHVVHGIARRLEADGFRRLSETRDWELMPGGKYYLSRGDSAVVAFRIPEHSPVGYMISASHSDRPAFKLKENGELTGTYTRLATERYGGMLIAPWLDRPLGVAGRVMVQTPEGVRSVLVDLDRDVAVIPNVAIHLNRTANENASWNLAVDTLALLGDGDARGKLTAELEAAAGGRILGQDLYLYLREEPRVWGFDGEYISGQALDDLCCVWGCLQGFRRGSHPDCVQVLAVLDGEEVGSSTPQGADSTLLSGILERISTELGLEHSRMLAGSMVVSADNVHAVHPNHPEFSDPANAPKMNGGVCVKFNAFQKYTTDGLSAALIRSLWEKAGVPTQTYYNRADLKGGATLGYLSLHHVSVPSADVGVAQVAMHSCYETAGTRDILYFEDAMTAFYSGCIRSRDGEYILQ